MKTASGNLFRLAWIQFRANLLNRKPSEAEIANHESVPVFEILNSVLPLSSCHITFDTILGRYSNKLAKLADAKLSITHSLTDSPTD